MTNILQELNAEMTSLVRRVRSSLVRVTNGPSGAGAGLIWNAEGLILTNAHVVHHDAPRVTLPDGQTHTARVLGHDPARDLALLAVKARNLPTLPMGDSRSLKPGDFVFAVGHPWGMAGAVTAGVVIGLGSQMPEMSGFGDGRRRRPTSAPNPREWLMVSLVLRPGNSGGPLVDARGRLVGINTIMTGPEVGGAVPAHVVEAFLTEVLSA